MDRLCAVLDMEFFQHRGNVWIREVGFASTLFPMTAGVNLQVRPRTLPLNDFAARRTLYYVRNHVHGLPFYPPSTTSPAAVPEHTIPTIVNALYHSVKTKLKDTIAYKGGQCEQELLEKLKIPCFDLEVVKGCPTYHKSLIRFPNCGHHTYCADGYLHCSTSEVLFYADWIRSTY